MTLHNMIFEQDSTEIRNAVEGVGLPPADLDTTTDLPPDAPPERPDILALKDCMCRWPIGHPGEAGFGFCGAPTRLGRSYCDLHHARAYPARKPKPLRDDSAG